MGSFEVNEFEGCEVEITPPDRLRELRHLRTVWTTRYGGELDWLGELEGLEYVNIDAVPVVMERFPAL